MWGYDLSIPKKNLETRSSHHTLRIKTIRYINLNSSMSGYSGSLFSSSRYKVERCYASSSCGNCLSSAVQEDWMANYNQPKEKLGDVVLSLSLIQINISNNKPSQDIKSIYQQNTLQSKEFLANQVIQQATTQSWIFHSSFRALN